MHFRLAIPLVLAHQAAAMVLPSLNGFDVESVFGETAILAREPESDAAPSNSASARASGPAPLIKAANAVSNRYIVVYNDGVSKSDVESHNSWISNLVSKRAVAEEQEDDKTVNFFGLPSLSGYSGLFSKDILGEIQNSPLVKYVEEDAEIDLYSAKVQDGATWGISRLSSRKNDGSLDSYVHDPSGGEGVTAYVVDTGVKVGDADFEGRAVYGKAVAFPRLPVDLHGHGSHVAGTIGSRTWGVAKSVDIVAVGVMGPLGTGLTSDIIKGIEYVVQDHQENIQNKKKGFKGSTVNMSIGGGASDALDAAANAATKAGVHVIVAAGNDNEDACSYSPARASGPITVGATDRNDKKAEFSNHGKCVDIHAPGVDIESIGLLSSPQGMSGTSMAAPHITGLVSYFLSLQPGLSSEFNSNLITPADFKSKLIKYGTEDIIKGLSKNTVNILAYNGAENTTEIWE
ncbi:hypothetical protein FT663_04834 [Candidozyma haemuli var. vulneris]|uniref:Peptidase S8/S53 domain-containing protein n=1 Tax=Candidozyma haemuli TaxID=45357 RepID=A0A2V1B247_9ASCO|nr:hypothetical protein CXQ85_003741 [[Candida] haemuloni]KAF3986564.1 hypothetical protein FT663_04834 [[Candida] haemuloni var. vulneris]KAF3988866.1 hypothetical protein FT662_03175 [[Candida] haemuloni var. vulneris]PVH23451.1 hypothetical protein CXQ85_003741 [[Candida] haemuloni]